MKTLSKPPLSCVSESASMVSATLLCGREHESLTPIDPDFASYYLFGPYLLDGGRLGFKHLSDGAKKKKNFCARQT